MIASIVACCCLQMRYRTRAFVASWVLTLDWNFNVDIVWLRYLESI